MEYSLAYLADYLGAEFVGNPNCLIKGVASLTSAKVGQISFCESAKHINKSKASAILVTQDLAKKHAGNLLIVPYPKRSFVKLLYLFYPAKKHAPDKHKSCVIGEDCYIDETAVLEPNVVIGSNVHVAAGCYIGAGSYLGEGVYVGAQTHLHPRVTVYHGCKIGQQCLIHSGVVIGADGFGFLPCDEGSWDKIPQIGGVTLHDNVEVGANSTIDRGALEDTIIGKGVKLDNLCMIAHNVEIGAHTIIAAGTAIAGSTKLGKRCIIGGATAISDHLLISDDVVLAGRSSVTRSITAPGVYASCIGVMSQRDWQKNVARLRQLDKIYRRVKNLEKEVQES